MDPRLPVLRADPVAGSAPLREQLAGLRERGTGPDDVAHPRIRLAGAEQELTTDDAIGGFVGEVGVRLGGLRVAAGGEVQVRVHARPAARVIGEQRVGRRAQPGRQVVQRRHRRLRVPQLERADVRLGVAIAGQLLLGQVGREPRGADAGADGLGQLALVDDDPTPGLELGIGHRADHTPGQVLVDRRSTLRRNSPSGHAEPVGHQPQRGERRDRPSVLDGGDEPLRERRAERLLGEARPAPPVAQLEAERDAARRGRGTPTAGAPGRSPVD